jgi:GTP-binding protein Era
VGEDQYVFLDTPGIHNPRTKLGDYMVKSANSALGEADAVILVVEPRESVGDIEATLIERIKSMGVGSVLVVNKIDAVTPANVAKTIAAYSAVHDFDAGVPMVAKNGKNVSVLLDECKRYLSESPWFFPDDIVTDQPERQIVAEIIREKLLRLLNEEIPHGTAVVIEAFEESGKLIKIRAEIFCEREAHKRIILGKQGSMLKTVGTYAREDLEKFFGVKVFLDLWVKVKEKWRDSEFQLSNFGYNKKDID